MLFQSPFSTNDGSFPKSTSKAPTKMFGNSTDSCKLSSNSNTEVFMVAELLLLFSIFCHITHPLHTTLWNYVDFCIYQCLMTLSLALAHINASWCNVVHVGFPNMMSGWSCKTWGLGLEVKASMYGTREFVHCLQVVFDAYSVSITL